MLTLRYHSTALRFASLTLRGTGCEDEESRAVRRNMPLVHLATGSMEFRPIFQP